MKSVEFDNVKAEKAQAMTLYKWKRNFALLLRFAAMFSASWLSTWSFSHSVDTDVDLLRESKLFLNRPVFIFTLLNLIIAVLFLLSGRKPTSSDVYDEHVAAGSHRIAADVSGEETWKSPEKSKQIGQVDNDVTDDSVNTVTDAVNTVADSDRVVRDDMIVSVTVSEVKEKKSYSRTVSDNLQTSKSKNRRELRRSETVFGGEMVLAEPPQRSMDDLSNEEFRRTIETFIAAKKKALLQENIAEIKGYGGVLVSEN